MDGRACPFSPAPINRNEMNWMACERIQRWLRLGSFTNEHNKRFHYRRANTSLDLAAINTDGFNRVVDRGEQTIPPPSHRCGLV